MFGLTFICNHTASESPEPVNGQAFQAYDATGDGSLNIEELRQTLKAESF